MFHSSIGSTPTGKLRQIVMVTVPGKSAHMPVRIAEENRATVFEHRFSGVTELRKIARENYLLKGVAAVVFGIPSGDLKRPFKYAVFVQDGFLVQMDENE